MGGDTFEFLKKGEVERCLGMGYSHEHRWEDIWKFALIGWDRKINKLVRMKISFIAKIEMLNTWALPVFHHIMMVTEMPPALIKPIEGEIYWVLKGKHDAVKTGTGYNGIPKNVLRLPRDFGGFSLVHVESRGKALLCKQWLTMVAIIQGRAGSKHNWQTNAVDELERWMELWGLMSWDLTNLSFEGLKYEDLGLEGSTWGRALWVYGSVKKPLKKVRSIFMLTAEPLNFNRRLMLGPSVLTIPSTALKKEDQTQGLRIFSFVAKTVYESDIVRLL